MLSDEEKKAIEILKDREYDFDELYCTFRQSFIKPYDKSIGIILELIEKQQKEIVHWKTGMKIIEKDKNNHIERLERRIEELDSENEVLEEIKISYEKKTDKLLKEKVKKEKEIEELTYYCIGNAKSTDQTKMIDKINELVKAINEIRKDKSND